MNSLKVQNFFILSCLFLFFQAQLGLGMKIEKVEMPSTILTTSGTPAEGRTLDALNACPDQYCKQLGSLTSLNDAYDYTLTMDTNSKITFQFAVSQSETEFGMYFVSDPAVSMTTNILLNPSDSWPDDYVGPISGPYWNIDLVIKSSTSSNRVLLIEIENGATTTTNIEFYIQVEAIQDNSELPLGLIIAMAVVGVLIFGIICICFRIKDRRRRGRISRAQAAYEAALANAIAHNQYRHGVSIVPIAIQNQYIENKPRDPRTIPLSKENFNQRFPEAPFNKFQSSFPQKTCSICLEDIGKNEKCRQLYCEHIFHSECVKLWLLNQMNKQNHGFCPNCNKNMTYPIGKEQERRNQIEIPVE